MRIIVAALALAACALNGAVNGPLALGTWGGDDAGVIVTDTTVHVYIGCTLGDAPRPSVTGGEFAVTGTYNITAFPVDQGVLHPAVFRGQVRGRMLTLTVTLTDTNVVKGPLTVELGREARMGPCPICRSPGEGR